jgi:serine/threonine protein kinase
VASQRVLAGRYELRARLGKGGMGEVWSAFDSVLRREVAVKTVDLLAAEDQATRERFAREAMATASLTHPNIVTAYDAGIDGSTAYLVMELLPGPTLNALVAGRGALPIDLAVRYTAQAAAALSAAHAVGVVHRDIKPGNLILAAPTELKVVDFGIARLTQANAAQLTATATVLGSAPYISPEQARGEPASPRSDVYALGCVLMALLTGEPPFGGDQAMALMHQHVHAPSPKAAERRADVPTALESLLDDMLSKEAAHRPTMMEVQSRLHALAQLMVAADETPSTKPLDVPSNAAPPPAYVDTPPSGTPTGRADHSRGSRRRRAVLGLVALASLALVAAVVWAILSLDNAGSTDGDVARNPGRGQQATSPTTPDPESSTPATSDSSSGPASTSASSPAVAVAALGAVVDSLTSSEEVDEHARDQLAHAVDKLEKSLEKDRRVQPHARAARRQGRGRFGGSARTRSGAVRPTTVRRLARCLTRSACV